MPPDTAEMPLNFGIGQPVTRSEDPRHLTGGGNYTDDTNIDGQVYARFVRSQIAHGTLNSVDISVASSMPGVIAIYTGADLKADDIGNIPSGLPLKNRDGSPYIVPPRTGLAVDRVRHVGEPIAVVVAETPAQAQEASEAVTADIDLLPVVTDAEEAVKDGAPLLHDEAPGNTCLDFFVGDDEAVEKAFAEAAHVTKVRIDNTRIVVNAMEPRSVIGEFDAESGRFTIHMPTQGVTGVRAAMSKAIFKIDPEQVRVLSNDVGGSFGMKGAAFVEPISVLYAARKLGRPVKWTADRSESFISDHHGRDSIIYAELALNTEGDFLGLKVTGVGNCGAYLTAMGPAPMTNVICRNIISVYKTPAFSYATKAVFTNTVPTGPYRGAGRPESKYIMEQLVDKAAREMGIDRVELRRRNLIAPDAFPYSTPNGQTYDCGEFEAIMDAALERADWNDFDNRKAESAANGKLRGISITNYLENTGAAGELADIRFRDDGTVALITGAKDMGTSHRTPFAQILHERLGVPYDSIEVIQNDSDLMSPGASGSGGSKTLLGAGNAIYDCAAEIIDKGKLAAVHILEAAVEDIEFAEGNFTVVGTDKSITVIDLAARLREWGERPDDVPESLDNKAVHDSSPSSYPNGCHVCEVEVEPETGVIDIVKYVVVDDFGVVINPLVVEGQVQGGIMQGVGQILVEHTVYDEDGQLVTGSYMDYCMPRADNICSIDFSTRNVPSVTNPLGVKGCGEAGNGGSMPAVMNAIYHALEDHGITELDAPATPHRVWEALQKAG
ncbi:MAG: carbon monoxide dehydrogenase [Rhodospirillaceae bacterium]|nr:carbon monoxide dehydrogenase [Rhodospirillaceae bacterium]|tara:strand:- start:2137 stop:4482 length:2346 start_codon:yes stop_codon:yes gene_type:complete